MFHLPSVERRLDGQQRLTRVYEVGEVLGTMIVVLGTLVPFCQRMMRKEVYDDVYPKEKWFVGDAIWRPSPTRLQLGAVALSDRKSRKTIVYGTIKRSCQLVFRHISLFVLWPDLRAVFFGCSICMSSTMSMREGRRTARSDAKIVYHQENCAVSGLSCEGPEGTRLRLTKGWCTSFVVTASLGLGQRGNVPGLSSRALWVTSLLALPIYPSPSS